MCLGGFLPPVLPPLQSRQHFLHRYTLYYSATGSSFSIEIKIYRQVGQIGVYFTIKICYQNTFSATCGGSKPKDREM